MKSVPVAAAAPEIGHANWRGYAAPRLDAWQWTAIVPAAGRGTRLGFDLPKILFPVAGRPILAWLLDVLMPHCGKAVFVLSPSGAAPVTQELEKRIPGRYKVVIQETPTGMGDAVALGLAAAATPQVAVVWGDQAALRRESVEACMRLHQGPLAPELTVPMLLRRNPYIHFERDAEGRITGLCQAREGDRMPEIGESDTGFFCFQADALRRLLAEARASEASSGAHTKEFNLLPVIPLAARTGLVLTPHIISAQETIGINSMEDAAVLEKFLRSGWREVA